MKINFIKFIFYLKNIDVIYRGIGAIVSLGVLSIFIIPDIIFNLSNDSSESVKMTIPQLLKTPKESLPRYIKITDAITPSNSVVEVKRKKSSLEIFYPVYPLKDISVSEEDIEESIAEGDTVQNSFLVDSTGNIISTKKRDNLVAKLVINDKKPSNDYEKELSSSKFSIEGRFTDASIPDDVLNIFKRENIKISSDVIVLERGENSMSLSMAIKEGTFCLVIAILSIISFFSHNTILKFFGLPTQSQYEENTNSSSLNYGNTDLFGTSFVEIPYASLKKRVGAFFIDSALLTIIQIIIIESFSGKNSIFSLVGLAVSLIFFVLNDFIFDKRGLGKKLLKLKLVNQDGTMVDNNKQLIIRGLVKGVCYMMPLVFIVVFVNKTRQALHDMAAKTFVAEDNQIS